MWKESIKDYLNEQGGKKINVEHKEPSKKPQKRVTSRKSDINKRIQEECLIPHRINTWKKNMLDKYVNEKHDGWTLKAPRELI